MRTQERAGPDTLIPARWYTRDDRVAEGYVRRRGSGWEFLELTPVAEFCISPTADGMVTHEFSPGSCEHDNGSIQIDSDGALAFCDRYGRDGWPPRRP